jgi:hypothetical protein
MKYYLSISFLLTVLTVFGQNDFYSKIDTSNYYDFSIQNATTKWLSIYDVAPIIKEELVNHGFRSSHTFQIYKLKDGRTILLTAYCVDLNIGIIYEQAHYMFKDKNQRGKSITKENTGNDYINIGYNEDGTPDGIKIETLPNNIFLMTENAYWFQIPNAGNNVKNFITKEIALKILRLDIQKIIKDAIKLKKK